MTRDRALRQSTQHKSKAADEYRLAKAKAKARTRTRAPIKHKFTQKELLLDALLTEVESQKVCAII